LKRLRTLSIEGISLNGESFRHIGRLTELETLQIHGSIPSPLGSVLALEGGIEQRDLQFLPDLRRLRRIDITSYDEVGNETCRCLQHLGRLQEVSFDRTSVTDAGVRALANLPNLTTLKLSETEVTGKAFDEPWAAPIRELDLSRTKISSDNVAYLVNLTELNQLNLSFTDISNEALVDVARIDAIRSLDVRHTHVSEGGLAVLSNRSGLVVRLATPVEPALRNEPFWSGGATEFSVTIP
jgi:hypothetical protein